ncbi:MAG: tRNA 2-thiocytidine(32) synthetase TtcA [Gammaproteobacteria bacterium]|nr:tRNA 2-thiocytidine(32) synthetase TtcA [Gammaproteobacteria bacterium]
MSKTIADFRMIENGDRIMVCLSGGKDSYTLLHLLQQYQKRPKPRFEIFAFTLDQSQPNWDDSAMQAWLDARGIAHETIRRNTYGVVKSKIPEGKSYCSLCSRLRRGNIYRYAADNGFTKIALGHHRDDLIESALMSMLYAGQIRSMPPKLLTDDKRHILIRPLAHCQERDIKQFAEEQQYPIIPCNLCGSQENLARQRVKKLIADLARENPKVPSNLLGALGNIKPSQLMDHDLWDFKGLDEQRLSADATDEPLADEAADPFALPSLPVDPTPEEIEIIQK